MWRTAGKAPIDHPSPEIHKNVKKFLTQNHIELAQTDAPKRVLEKNYLTS